MSLPACAALVPLLVACGEPPRRARAAAPDGSPAADSGSAPRDTARPDSGPGVSGAGDTAAEPDLVWSGDLAPYDGCVAGDPAAKLLSQAVPAGPVAAGSTVTAELVFANCESAPWVAATSTEALSGVKLGSLSATRMDTWGRARVLLPANVPPAHAVRIRHDAVAPLVNGPHPWRWQLVDEWVRWIDAPTPDVSVEIVGGYGPFGVHPREEWQEAAYPVTGAGLDLRDLRYITLHYNGHTEDLDGGDDIYTDADMIDSLRGTQRSYVEGRGYSSGYNIEIAPDGDEWEVRGQDFVAASNGCAEVNGPAFTIQIPTAAIDADPTPAQVEGARAAILRIRTAAAAAGNPHALSLNGHGDVRVLCEGLGGTSCPGEPIKALLAAGAFEP